MIQTLVLAKAEDISESEQIAKELENPKITPKRAAELSARQERLVGPILRKCIDEALQDLNLNLGGLYRGNLLKTYNEKYEVEVENQEFPQRYGWVTEFVKGEKVMYDPSKDESERVYKPIPRAMVERVRTVYSVETNRKAIERIGSLITEFFEKCKGEFLKNTSISKILDEKKRVEYEISQVDRNLMKKEEFSEIEFADAFYIKKPIERERPISRHQDTEKDLLKRFDDISNRK